MPFSNDGPTYPQAEKHNPKVWPWCFFPSLCGQRYSKEGRQEDTQAGFAATGANIPAALQQASGAAQCDMDISAAVSHLSVPLTNTCRGLIKLNLALFSSNSPTQNQFKKGKINFVSSAFFDIGLKFFKYRTFTSGSWGGMEGVEIY